jgi:GNAT superfamily N-acetyltransferase
MDAFTHLMCSRSPPVSGSKKRRSASNGEYSISRKERRSSSAARCSTVVVGKGLPSGANIPGAASTSRRGTTSPPQSFLDFGQRDFYSITCKSCGMVYCPGEPGDERSHTLYCRKLTRPIPCQILPSAGHGALRLPSEHRHAPSDALIMVDRSNPKHWKVARAVLEHRAADELGGSVWDAVCRERQLHVVLYKRAHSVAGCLVFETVGSRHVVRPVAIDICSGPLQSQPRAAVPSLLRAVTPSCGDGDRVVVERTERGDDGSAGSASEVSVVAKAEVDPVAERSTTMTTPPATLHPPSTSVVTSPSPTASFASASGTDGQTSVHSSAAAAAAPPPPPEDGVDTAHDTCHTAEAHAGLERSLLGVRVVWVEPQFRRQGVASALITSARTYLTSVPGVVLQPGVAYSQLTASGMHLATSLTPGRDAAAVLEYIV